MKKNFEISTISSDLQFWPNRCGINKNYLINFLHIIFYNYKTIVYVKQRK